MVHTTLSVGATTVQCDEWSADTGTWDTPRGATRYDASGSTVPPTSQVTTLEDSICSDPKAAAKALLQALSAGGARAQAAVYALVNADCSGSTSGGSSGGGSSGSGSSGGGSSGGGSSGGGSSGGGSSGGGSSGGSSGSSDPVDQTYKLAIGSVNTGDPADLPAVEAFFAALIQAADAVGVPACASIAVVDEDTGEALKQEQLHTGTG
ncbi:hypothetical protein ABPG75_013687 [Micractinium tetrahymenae]